MNAQLHIRHGITPETVQWIRREAFEGGCTQGEVIERLVKSFKEAESHD